MSGHHANDGTASRILRGLLSTHGYDNGPGTVERAVLHIENQRVRCARGEHNEREARKGYVTYVGLPGRKRQVHPGTRYCHFCQLILSARCPHWRPARRHVTTCCAD
jgi:hypothetical protein